MKHLLKHGKDTTYLHSIYWGLFVMHEPIADMIDFVEWHQWIVQYLWDSEWNSCPVLMDYIDVIFDWKEIWYNNMNEEFFNQLQIK
jgi:hypothetical protein